MNSLTKISVFLGAIALIAFSFSPRAHAQSGGPGADAGVVKSIDDGILEIRSGSHTTQYIETDSTKWLDANGRRIDAGDTVGKMVEVRFRWVTGGSEAMSVQISRNSRASAGVESIERPSRAKSNDWAQIFGTVKSIDDMILDLRDINGGTQSFTQTDQTRWLNKRGKPIDAGDTVGKSVVVTYRVREVLSVQLR